MTLFAFACVVLTVLHFHQGIDFSLLRRPVSAINGSFFVSVLFGAVVFPLGVIYQAIWKITVSGDTICFRYFIGKQEIKFYQIKQVTPIYTKEKGLTEIALHFGEAQNVRSVLKSTSRVESDRHCVPKNVSNFNIFVEALKARNVPGAEEIPINS